MDSRISQLEISATSNGTSVQSASEWTLHNSLFTSLICIFLIWYVQYHWNRRHLYKLASKVPGPPGLPILGNCLDFVGNCSVIYNNITKIYDSYPDLFKFWYGPTLIYGVSKPEYLEKVLTSPKALSKMYLYRYAVPLGGHGLFTAPVSIWKRHRKIISPAFNQRVLDGFVEVFGSQSTIMVEELDKLVGKGEFDVFHVVSKTTLNIICESAMGVKVNGHTADSVFSQWIDRLMEIMFLRMFVFWYHFDFIFRWTKLCQDERQLLKKFNTFTENVVKEKRLAFEQNTQQPSNKRKAFLDLLIEFSTGDNKLTDEEIRDEVNTFMVAGSDTTASSISFTLLLLGMHPDVQEKVYEEIVNVVGLERLVQPQDLPLLEYTERVIKESLRLFPVGAISVRNLTEDLPLEDDLVLPKGSSVALGFMRVHRDPKYWPDPLKFEPDRFLSTSSTRHPFTFIPFAGGSRNCIGPKYAMMSMKSLLAMTLRKFKFFTSYDRVEDIKLKANLVLRTTNGFNVSVHLRK
ncbi:unnamed protein product [Tenebrio molitor]|nr:unnamed protein product [Tenebrio molitor]